MSKANGQAASIAGWTSMRAYTLAAICLLVGVGAGWLMRGSQSPATQVQASTANMPQPGAQPTPEQMKHMADKQAEPLLAQLQSDPNNPQLLARIGDIYYDTRQFPTAIEYYQRVLQAQPANANTRTDMASAYWYLGKPDQAITELEKALTYEPTKPNTLFNLGIVKWQGKMDVAGAIAAWEKLLKTNPDYEHKDKVNQLIAEAKKHSGIKPGTQAKGMPQ